MMNQTLTEKLINATSSAHEVIVTHGNDTIMATMTCTKALFIKRYAERLQTTADKARCTANTLAKLGFLEVTKIADEYYVVFTPKADKFLEEYYIGDDVPDDDKDIPTY